MVAFLLHYDVMGPKELFNPDFFLHRPTSDQFLSRPHLHSFSGHDRICSPATGLFFSSFWKLFRSTPAPEIRSTIIESTVSSHATPDASRLNLSTWRDKLRMPHPGINSNPPRATGTSNPVQPESNDSSTLKPVLRPTSPQITTIMTANLEWSSQSLTVVAGPSPRLVCTAVEAKIDTTTAAPNATLVQTFSPRSRASAPEDAPSGFIRRVSETGSELPASAAKNQEIPLSTATCAVCMESICEQNDTLKLICGHHFHAERCIIPWIERNASCPVCRHQLAFDPVRRVDNPTLPDHLFHAYTDLMIRSSAGPSTRIGRLASASRVPQNFYVRSASLSNNNHRNETAILTATIWDSYSRFMM